MPLDTGPDYRCYGQGDGSFVCDKLTITPVDVAWLGGIGAMILVLLIMIVIDWRSARARRSRGRTDHRRRS